MSSPVALTTNGLIAYCVFGSGIPLRPSLERAQILEPELATQVQVTPSSSITGDVSPPTLGPSEPSIPALSVKSTTLPSPKLRADDDGQPESRIRPVSDLRPKLVDKD